MVGVLFAALLLAGALLTGAQPADAQEDLSVSPKPTKKMQNSRDLDKGCTTYKVPVEVEAQTYKIYGELCKKAGTDPRTVQVPDHGITYGTYYWDFPKQSGKYSWVDYMNDAGYATFNIDRIGIGRSDHPPSAQVTLANSPHMN